MEFLSDTSPTIAWPGQLLSQSVWLYFHYPWCSFMNHLLRSLNGIFISPGFMIHLNTCCKKNNVKNYSNHMSYDIVASSFSLNQMWRHILVGILMGIFDGNPWCLFLDLWYFRWRGTRLSAWNCLLSLRMFPLYSGEPPGGHLQSSHTNQLLSLSKQSNNYKIAFCFFYAVLTWCF